MSIQFPGIGHAGYKFDMASRYGADFFSRFINKRNQVTAFVKP